MLRSTPIVLPPWVNADPDRSMAVSAGAGSGKTTSLVARVAALMEMPGVQPSQLVVITFTEKAAREVSHRLREAVGRLGVTRRSVHRHHPRVLPIAAAALSDRGRAAPQVHDGRRADLGGHGRRARRAGRADALQPGAEEAGDRRGVDGDRLVRRDAVPPRTGQGHRQRLAALRRLVARASDVDRGCPLDGHAHARQRHVRSAIPGGQQRHANEARRGARSMPARRWSSSNRYRRFPPPLSRSASADTGTSPAWAPVCRCAAFRQLRAGARSVDVGADTDRDRLGAQPHQPRRAVVRRPAGADPSACCRPSPMFATRSALGTDTCSSTSSKTPIRCSSTSSPS